MRAFLGAVLVVVAWCSHAHAQASDFRARDAGFIGKDPIVLEIDDCPPLPQRTPEEQLEIGREHFRRGVVLYDQGDYKGAVVELAAAYCIKPTYTILKDIGTAYERELDFERAIAYLERFIMEMPKDLQPTNGCTDPAGDRARINARIRVLEDLPAKILVNTEPADAQITLFDARGISNRTAIPGQEIEVSGGHYEVLIEKKGYLPVKQEITARIGKPYTLFARLEPKKGHVRVRTVPANARLFLDQKQVGIGEYEGDLPGGRYSLVAEANGHITDTREIEVLAERETPVSIELAPVPQSGRRQFIAYATVAGGVAAGTLAGATSDPGVILFGAAAGLTGGFFGSYFATPRDIPLGTSSLTITSSLVGGVLGGASTVLFTGDGNRIAPAVGSGLVLGGLAGYYLGDRVKISPGDAAVINSGALWGTVTGALFSTSFEANSDRRIGAGLWLSGLGMGTLGGVLMTRYFDVSRTRAALIDLGGLVGVFVGAAIDNVVAQANSSNSTDSERTANYTLGGLATGLILSAVLTRNYDAPKVSVTPVVSRTQATGSAAATTTFGISGAF